MTICGYGSRISASLARDDEENLRRHRFDSFLIIEVVHDRGEGRERLGRKRDRLAVGG